MWITKAVGHARGILRRIVRDAQRRRFVRRVKAGFLMDLDPWEWLQANLRVHGIVEPLTTRLYSQILRKADVVLDIGAHVGYQALLARSLVGDSGRVIAVEPQPYNAGKIL